jgi:hypothetical protein
VAEHQTIADIIRQRRAAGGERNGHACPERDGGDPEPTPEEEAEYRRREQELLGRHRRGDAAEPGPVTPPGAAPGRHRPTVTVSTDERAVNDAAIAALAAGEPDLYQRGGHLVRVIRDGAGAPCLRRGANAPRIGLVEEPTLQEMMAASLRWVGPDAERSERPAHPPQWSVRQVLRRGAWPGIRHLAGVVEAPCLRPDGTVLDRPGYDADTGLLFESATGYPPVPEGPSRADAERAAATLLELVAEFPFAGECHLAAWLAALLTVFARPAVAGPCPLFLFEASAAGCGKTLLAEVIGIIATGREPAVSELSSDNEETRKAITAILIEGERLVLLDNASYSLGCSALDAALTATTWKGRVLGRSQRTTDLPIETVWLATGNNLMLRGDTHRRVVPCRLEPECERPEERSGFRHPDLKAHVRENRPALVVAALTVLRAHAAAGRRAGDLPPFGSYDAWSAVVRQAVHWATGEDPCATRAAITPESRGDLATLAAVLEGWAELPGGRQGGLTARKALELVGQAPALHAPLREALAEWARDGADLPDARTLGNRLRAARGRVAGPWRLVAAAEESHRKVARWRVEAAGARPDAGSAGSAGSVSDPSRARAEIPLIGEGAGNDPADHADPASEVPW